MVFTAAKRVLGACPHRALVQVGTCCRMDTVGSVDVGVGSLLGMGKCQIPTAGLLWAPFLGRLGQGRCGKLVEGH